MTAREIDALFTLTGGAFDPNTYREFWIAPADQFSDGKRLWVATGQRAEFERKLQAVSLLGGWVSLIPRLHQDRHFIDRSAVAWVRIETGAARASLAAFTPEPTLILQDGDTLKCTALWWLSTELNRAYLLKANERLAHALGGVKAATFPEGWISPPGPGTDVRVAHLDVDARYHPNQLVGDERPDGRLADPPPKRNFRRRGSQTSTPLAVAA